jgi:hypothetical protein
MREQRKFERYGVRLAGRIEVTARCPGRQKEIFSLTTRDVSAGGAFFWNADSVPEGTEVKIDLVLDLERLKERGGRRAVVKVRGTVLRRDPHGMAVGFDKGCKFVPFGEHDE